MIYVMELMQLRLEYTFFGGQLLKSILIYHY